MDVFLGTSRPTRREGLLKLSSDGVRVLLLSPLPVVLECLSSPDLCPQGSTNPCRRIENLIPQLRLGHLVGQKMRVTSHQQVKHFSCARSSEQSMLHRPEGASGIHTPPVRPF